MAKRKINQDELRRLLDAGTPVKEICAQLDVCAFAVYQNMRAMGIPTAKQRKAAERLQEQKRDRREKETRAAEKQDTPEKQGAAKKKPARAEYDADRSPGERDYFTRKACGECGKEFTVQNCDLYVYKRFRAKKWHYYCSWGCYRKEEGRGR